MSEQLLPCPFCGGSNISDGEVCSSTGTGALAVLRTFVWQSKCMDCGALGREGVSNQSSMEQWNTRASPQGGNLVNDEH